MSETVLFILAAFFMGIGIISIVIATIGIFRFNFVMNRMHAAAIIDTLGLFSIVLGLCFVTHSLEYIPKLLLIVVFQWIGSPIASHFVGRLEVSTDNDIGKFAETEDDSTKEVQ